MVNRAIIRCRGRQQEARTSPARERGARGDRRDRSQIPPANSIRAVDLEIAVDQAIAATRQRIRRGIFHDVAELETAIHQWIEHRNQDPKPFTWTAKAKPILASHRRAKKALASVNEGCK